ncbi:MAG: guanylate kinase [Vicinamibacteria bacterium]
MSKRLGSLLVISAPSGSGKTTLVRELVADVKGVEFSVSYTTRSRRSSEKEGVDYHFVSEREFRSKIEGNDFLEWAEVHERLYGTGRAKTEGVLRGGVDVVLDIDVQGAAQVKQAMPDAVLIFILPPSFEVLEQRLRDRRQNEEADIERRLTVARREVSQYQNYDYAVVNDEIERCAGLLQSIVLAERARRQRMEPIVRSILDSFK